MSALRLLLRRPDEDDWMDDALCAEVGTDLFFPEKGEPAAAARRLCARCGVRDECLEYALSTEINPTRDYRHGIYGGTTPAEREAIAAARKQAAA